MPYSITTKDGITVDNIPDDVPADAGTLKAHVAKLRAERGGAPVAPAQQADPAPAAPTSAPNVSAPQNGFLMGLRDPIDGMAQIARRGIDNLTPAGIGGQIMQKITGNKGGSVADAIDSLGNFLAEKGVPGITPSTGVAGVDNVVKGVNQKYDQQRQQAAGPDGPGFDVARLAGNIINPTNVLPGTGIAKAANTVGKLALSGARAGAVGGLMQPVIDGQGGEFAAQKVIQALTGAATGGTLTPAVAKGSEAAINGVRSAMARSAPAPDINVAVNNVFQSHGVNPAEVSDAIRQSVTQQVQEAITARAKIDPASMIRRAEFETVGLTGNAAPTSGQMSRDAMQWAKEKNLSGINIDGKNALSDRFTAQNQALQGVFDNAGATQATDRTTAGGVLSDALRASDVPVKGGVDDLYTAAKGMTDGHEALIDAHHFTQNAYRKLDEEFLTDILPPEARSLLDKIAAGDMPLNVKNSVVLDRLFGKMQREAGSGTNKEMAIGMVRTALHDAPMMPFPARAGADAANAADQAAARTAATDAGRTVDNGVTDVNFTETGRPELQGKPRIGADQESGIAPVQEPQYSPVGTDVALTAPAPVDEGQAAREAFDQARRAARSRFSTIEDTPALKAALDEAAPDNFVQKFILGANAGDVEAMNRVLANSPEAQAQARAQVADFLKRAAFGENPSGDKAFAADRYLKTLTAFGPQKLRMFFSPEEVVRLNLAGKVASDINSIPVGAKYGTNTSGTAAAAINAISGVLDKIPGGKMLSVPVNFMKNEYGKMQTQKSIAEALQAPQVQQELTALAPELIRLLGGIGGAGAVAGGAATAPKFGNQ